MKRYFADAFFFFAWWNRRDQAHGRVQDFLVEFDGDLVTTRWVLTEVADGLASTPARARVRGLFEELETDSMLTVVSSTEALYRRGLALYDQRPDKQWSLTDCISFVVMGDEGLTEALTGDHHFEQAGFAALLA